MLRSTEALISRLALLLVFCGALLAAPSIVDAEELLLGVGPPPPPDTLAFAGQSVAYAGMITNLTNATLTGDDFEFSFSDFDARWVSPVNNISPRLVLRPGESSGMIDLFDVNVLGAAPPQTYSIGVTLIGNTGEGADFATNALIRSNTVTVRLIVQPTAVPEPATVVLAGTGLFGLAARRFRRRR